MSFSDLGLSPKVLSAVEAAGFITPTPIQLKTLPVAVSGRDVLGIAQTGTGKTASFVLPMLTRLERGRARARMPRSLILEPTRELAAQVAEHFEILGKQPQAHRGASHRRRVLRRPGPQARSRRRRGDRDTRPAARPFRARQAAPERHRDPRGGRSRPHARHGLHPGRRAHLQAPPLHAADHVLLRDDAAGNSAPRRQVPAQPRTHRSGAAGDRRGDHRPAAQAASDDPAESAKRFGP